MLHGRCALRARAVARMAALALHALVVEPDQFVAFTLATVGASVLRCDGIDRVASGVATGHHLPSELNANCPRSTFLKRDAAPLSRASRIIAAYTAAAMLPKAA